MVIDKICKMSLKGVKLKSEIFFQYLLAFWSYGGKTLGGQIPSPSLGPDRVKCENWKFFVMGFSEPSCK